MLCGFWVNICFASQEAICIYWGSLWPKGTYASYFWDLAQFLPRSVHTGLSITVFWKGEATRYWETWILLWALPLSWSVNLGHILPSLDPLPLAGSYNFKRKYQKFSDQQNTEMTEGGKVGGKEREGSVYFSCLCLLFFPWNQLFSSFFPWYC